MRKLKKKTKFPWLTERTLKDEDIEITKHRSKQLRSQLPKSIYWIQPVPRGQISWNAVLIKDYLLFGDRPEHQVLVEQYMDTNSSAA